jgi:hypothetical protein
MTVKVTKDDFHKYIRRFRSIEKRKVVAGVFTDSNGSELIKKAFYNEFGTSRIPKRSFLRQNDIKKKVRIEEFLDIIKSVDSVFSKIGLQMSSIIKERIRDIRTPVNAPSTIAKKGSSNPLIDSGELINSIDFDLRR